MELWDVLDASGIKTGRTVARGQQLKAGEFHLAVHIWIQDEAGDYLIQQRSAQADSGAGIWTPTLGHVRAGEESIFAAVRETQEELGLTLTPDDLTRIHRLTTGHLIQDVYLVVVKRAIDHELNLGPEVSQTQWASKLEIKAMMDEGTFFPYNYFDDLIP